jgi:hypothetical protein
MSAFIYEIVQTGCCILIGLLYYYYQTTQTLIYLHYIVLIRVAQYSVVRKKHTIQKFQRTITIVPKEADC